MQTREETTGMVSTPSSASEVPNWMFGEGEPNVPSFEEMGVKFEYRYNEQINKWSVTMRVPDNVPMHIKTDDGNEVSTFHGNFTLYDISDDCEITILTDRKHTHERYQSDGEKHRMYKWR